MLYYLENHTNLASKSTHVNICSYLCYKNLHCWKCFIIHHYLLNIAVDTYIDFLILLLWFYTMAGILCPLFPKMRFHLASTLLMLAVTWISLWLLLCHLIICYICVLVVKMLVEVNVPTKCRKMIWHPDFICIYIGHYSRILMCYLWCFLSTLYKVPHSFLIGIFCHIHAVHVIIESY